MGNIRMNLGLRAIVFMLGFALIMVALSNIVMFAAYIIANGTMFMNMDVWYLSAAMSSALFGGIGGLFVFIGWNAERPLDDPEGSDSPDE